MSLKKDVIAILVGLVITIGLFGSVYTVKLQAPDNAVVYADPDKKIYYAPPYIDKLDKLPKPEQPVEVKKLKAMPLKDVRALNYNPDRASREGGYFVQRYRNLTAYLLEKTGLVNPLPLRWTSDGDWNW